MTIGIYEMIKTYLLLHLIAFVLGFFLDLIVGDPHWLLHPVQVIGWLISLLEKIFLGKDEEKRSGSNNGSVPSDGKLRDDSRGKKAVLGIVCVIIVLAVTVLVITGLIILSYTINSYLGMAIEAVMTYQILATKSLKRESMKVYKALKTKGLEEGRKAVSMIVGRDTENLSEEGVIKAAVETVAENTSDGVIAPMIFTFLGGPILGFAYKAVNTMDSMIGYKNDKYLYYGRAAAKLDDLVNFIPARISALLLIAASLIGGKDYSAGNAFKIFKRDRYNHASPNSAQTESACAGALGLKLAGDASYFGKIVKKPFIGDEIRKPDIEDIKKVNALMFISAYLCMIICAVLGVGIYYILNLLNF